MEKNGNIYTQKGRQVGILRMTVLRKYSYIHETSLQTWVPDSFCSKTTKRQKAESFHKKRGLEQGIYATKTALSDGERG